MARDYKYRANSSKKKPQATKVAWWKWLLIVLLICLFISFLVFLTNSTPESPPKKQASKSTPVAKKIKQSKVTPEHQDKKPKAPSYVFYNLLVKEETVVPDYEIKIRTREELVGKIKPSKYIIQAGSFRDTAEADKLKALLTLLAYQPRIEKAKVKNTVWNRVKLGPFSRPTQVSSITKRLKQNGIDVIVTEIKK